MKNLLFAVALVPALLVLSGCGKQTKAEETEYTVTVEVDQPERVSGAMQNPNWEK